MAFPSNNVVVLMETPRLPDDSGEGVTSGPPSLHVFLRGHADRVTRVELSNAGHLLASAQGDTQGDAGGGRMGGGGSRGWLFTIAIAILLSSERVDHNRHQNVRGYCSKKPRLPVVLKWLNVIA